MSKLIAVLRIVLGLAFLVFGLNYFLHFLPEPPPSPQILEFVIPFVAAKYMGLVKTIEIAAGAALLANRFVPLALTLLAPILVGILNFHAALAPSGLPVPLVLTAIEIVLAWSYRDAFAPLFHARTAPRAAAEREVRRTAAA
jgi:uncharacterized membrane protein YphA (DoxX/SURF4 family)